MAENYYACDVEQAFTYEPTAQTKVGHITSLKIGKDEIKADVELTNPEKIDGDPIYVVGAISSFYWKGGITDRIGFVSVVSDENKAKLAVLQDSKLSDTTVEFKYSIYQYDADKKKSYLSCHSGDATLKGIIAKDGNKLDFNIEEEPSSEVEQPEVFELNFGVNPNLKQDVLIAKSDADKYVKQWGINKKK